MPDASLELPYDSAKPMLLVDNVENRDFLKELVLAMYDELPLVALSRHNIRSSFTSK